MSEKRLRGEIKFRKVSTHLSDSVYFCCSNRQSSWA